MSYPPSPALLVENQNYFFPFPGWGSSTFSDLQTWHSAHVCCSPEALDPSSSAARIDLVILASLPSLGQALQPPFGAVPVASELSWACVDALGVAPVLSLGEEASAAEADGPGLGLDSLIALTLLLEWGKGGYAV